MNTNQKTTDTKPAKVVCNQEYRFAVKAIAAQKRLSMLEATNLVMAAGLAKFLKGKP